MRKLLQLLAFILLTTNSAMATHISGGEIVWDCLGNGQYEFSAIIYRDCDGIDAPDSVNLEFSSPCGSQDQFFTLVNIGGTEISQLCSAQIGNSTCNGGSLPGMQAYIYTGIVTLADCDFWTVSWSTCCRNNAVINLANAGGAGSYFEATLNTLDFACNSSARFTAQPIPYVCQGQAINYSFGAYDPDADSLSYTLISAMAAGAAPLGYNGGYSPVQPVPGAVINAFTGLLSFTPALVGNFVFVVLVGQYDSAGNLIGTVMRDIQFVVIPCTNNQPRVGGGVITSITGSALLTDSMSIQMCAVDSFCFEFVISDLDPLDTLTLASNVSTVLSGATFSQTGVNPVTGRVCWTASPGSEGLYSFFVTAQDDACPIPGLQTYVYDIQVVTRTTAGSDHTICGTQVAQLDGDGGSSFTWSVLSGDPIVVGQNFSCNPCAAPIAIPASTTTYMVTSDLNCLNMDTVVVNVVTDFSFVATQSDAVVCLGEVLQFNIVTNPVNTGGYTFAWASSVGLSNPTIADPTGVWVLPGIYNYLVEITSPNGCKLDTNLSVEVVPAFLPDFTVIWDDSTCEGGSTVPQVVLNNGVPGTCGINYTGCDGSIVSAVEIGSDLSSNTTTGYPAPYGNFYNGARHQMLFRASELVSLGFTAGTITELGWNVDALNGLTEYLGYEIRMACTTQDELTQWITGTDIVFPAQTVNVVQGWNVHQFQYSFDWDGFSNLIVEVCFDMAGITTFTQNSSTYYTTTPYNSCLYYRSDGGGVCYGGTPTISADRPNTRFSFCSGVNQALTQYNWTPVADVNPTNSATPTITPSTSPQTFTVVVGDPALGCFDTQDITINWYSPVQVSFLPSPGQGVYPLNVQFYDTSPSDIVAWDWSFGDPLGSTSNLFDPSLTFNDPGWYYVTLTGTDANGCTGTYLDSIEVFPNSFVAFPNVFSPNGDGVNDHFEFLEFRGFRSFELKIFNRWGGIVREVSKVSTNKRIWSPGTTHSEGTYFYTFVGQGADGKMIERTGHITLVRLSKD